MKSEGLKQSQKHEKRIAKRIGGKTRAASGAFWSGKGDVRNDEYLWEHKYTSKKSFSVTRTVLDKIEEEAIMDGRTPVLGLHIDGKDYVVLTEDDFIELLGETDV